MKNETDFTQSRRRRTLNEVLAVLGTKGIRLIAGEYSNNKAPFRCQCARCDYVWDSCFNNIQQGHGCPECANLARSLKQRLSENGVRRFLADRRITLLGDYHDSKSLLALRCEVCGYEWRMRFNGAQQGRGCTKCAVRRRADSHRHSESHVRQFFKARAITLLGSYVGSDTPTACRCDKCGYEWLARYHSIQQDQGCPKCAGHAPLTKRDYLELAAKHGGRVLSFASSGERSSTWQCRHGHVFQRSYESVKRHDTFCTVCSGRKRRTREDFEALAADHGGRLKSMGKNTQVPSIWACRLGHEFARSYTDIKTDGNFCPECSHSLAERQCKAALEQIFRVPFKKVKLKNLRGAGGGPLELDAYNAGLKLALEHHGLQHYKPARFGNQTQTQADRNFERQQLHDQLRRDYCRKHGIALIEIRELGRYTPFGQLKEAIRDACLRQGVCLPADFDKIQLDLKSAKLRTEEEEMWGRIKYHTEESGFRLLTETYLGSQTPHEFMCKNGHVFKKRPYALFIGQGCKQCYEQSRRTPVVFSDGRLFTSVLDAAKALGTSQENLSAKLDRGNGHRGVGLARISREEFCFSRRDPIALAVLVERIRAGGQMCGGVQKLRQKTWGRILKRTKQLGYQIVSETYEGYAVKHRFLCDNGHEFLKTPMNFLKGQRCPKCPRQLKTHPKGSRK